MSTHASPDRSETLGGRVALAAATILTGLSAGFFYTFEASITRGLAEVDAPTYVETFRAVNDTIQNGLFGIVFFGSIPAIIIAAVANWRSADRLRRALLAAALPLYLACLLVTGTGNVPLNDELAEAAIETPADATRARAEFEDEWNDLNLVRSLAVVGSFIALVGAGLIGADRRTDQIDDDTDQQRRPRITGTG